MTDYKAMAELERRGALPEDLKGLLNQARQKGLAPPVAAPSMPWSDVAYNAAGNLGSSAGNFAYNITAPIHSPIQTAKGLGQVAAGVGSKIVRAADTVSEAVGGPDLQTPEEAEAAEAPINAVGQFFKDRYGGIENIKKTLAEDPVGAMADAAAVLTGGGMVATRFPGVVGRAGQTVQRVGQAIDPVVASGRLAAGTVRTAAPYVGRAAEAYSGLGEGVTSELYRAGRQGGAALDVATDNMRGQVPQRNVVDQAQGAMGQLRQNRSAEYTANMANTTADNTPLNIGAVRQELAVLRGQTNFRNNPGTGDPNALNALDDIERVIDQFEGLPAGQGATAEGLDFLKKRIGDLRAGARQGTPERRVIDRMYNAARDQVAQQVPDYAAAMQGYENASELIDEAARALSLNDRATLDTTLRKLQSVMRNNANTGYGHRAAVLDELETVSPGLRPALAGQAASSWAPRGINRAGIAGGVGTGLALGANPVTLAGVAAASSPRLVGEGAVLAGRAAQAIDNATNAAGINAPNVARITTPAAQIGNAGLQASPSKQTERALQQFKAAANALKSGAGTPEAFRQTVGIVAQIIARETGDDPSAVAQRLVALVEGAQ